VGYSDRNEAEFEAAGFRNFKRELHGTSVFLREGHRVFHTYSTDGRGTEQVGARIPASTDVTALGRQCDREGGSTRPATGAC
jgi:predicted dithiol-disulfide oxidoreductase (DUF899 family)